MLLLSGDVKNADTLGVAYFIFYPSRSNMSASIKILQLVYAWGLSLKFTVVTVVSLVTQVHIIVMKILDTIYLVNI